MPWRWIPVRRARSSGGVGFVRPLRPSPAEPTTRLVLNLAGSRGGAVCHSVALWQPQYPGCACAGAEGRRALKLRGAHPRRTRIVAGILVRLPDPLEVDQAGWFPTDGPTDSCAHGLIALLLVVGLVVSGSWQKTSRG